jgi:hypothetical protein
MVLLIGHFVFSSYVTDWSCFCWFETLIEVSEFVCLFSVIVLSPFLSSLFSWAFSCEMIVLVTDGTEFGVDGCPFEDGFAKCVSCFDCLKKKMFVFKANYCETFLW